MKNREIPRACILVLLLCAPLSPRAAEYPWLAKCAWWRPYQWDHRSTEVQFLMHCDEAQPDNCPETRFLLRPQKSLDDGGKAAEPGTAIMLGEDADERKAGTDTQIRDVANAKPMGQKGLLRGGVEFCKDGRFGGGLGFAGGDGVLVLPEKKWRLDCTVEFWIKPAELPREPAVLFQALRTKHSESNPATLELMPDGALRFVWLGKPSPATDKKIKAGEWRHVVFQYAGKFSKWTERGKAMHADILLDGVPALSAPIQPDSANYHATPQDVNYYIGNDSAGMRGFKGVVDEICFSESLREYYLPDTGWVDPRRPVKDMHKFPFLRDAADLSLHIPFDNSLAPAKSAPGTKAVSEVQMEIGEGEGDFCLPGVVKEGLVLGKGGLAPSYPSAGNVDLSRGTAAFWMRPVNWDNLTRYSPFDKCEPHFVELFNVLGDFPKDAAPARWKGPWPLMRLLFIQNIEQGLSDPPELSPARWTHVAVTWDDERIRYYLDGKEFAAGGDRGPFMSLVTPDNDYWLGASKDRCWRSRAFAESIDFKRGGGGLWHPYWHVRKEEPNTIIDDFRIYRRALAPAEVANLYALYRPDADPKPLPQAEMKYKLNALKAVLDVEAYPLVQDYAKIAKVRIFLSQKGLPEPVMDKAISCDPMGYVCARLESRPLDFGSYTLAVEFQNESGATLAKASKGIVRERPPWWENRLGLSDKVMPEFEPMKVSGNVVSVVCRDIHLAACGLPEKVVSMGGNLLARPIKVEAAAAGKPVEWRTDDKSLKFLQSNDVRVDWEGRMAGGGVEMLTKAYMEYDGMMWFDITVRGELSGASVQLPDGEAQPLNPETRNMKPSLPTLDSLTIRIPYRPEDAELMNCPTYFLPERTDTDDPVLRNANRDIGATPAAMGVVYRSNDQAMYAEQFNRADAISGGGGEKELSIGKGMYKFPMEKAFLRGSWIPCMHLMGMERGMFWFAENDRGWTQSTKVPAVVVERKPESVDLVLNIISEKITLDAPRTFSFGLIPHPLRKLRPDWRRWPGWGVPMNCGLKGDEDQVFSLLPKNGDFSKVPAYWQAAVRERGLQEKERQDFREKYGRGPGPYERTVPGGFYFTPAIAWVPDHTREFAERWENDTAQPWATIDRNFVDFSAWCHDQWAKTGILQGYYIDGHCKGWEAVDRGNLAYTLPDGHVQPGYGFRHLREFFKRMRQTLWDQKIVPHICNHSSGSPPMPGMAFVDVWLESEHFYCSPPSQRDHLDTWPPARMRIDHIAKWNIIPKPLGWTQNPPWNLEAWTYRQFRAFDANMLVHDICWPDLDLKMEKPEIDADPVTFIPYWKDGGLARHGYGEDVLVSAWKEADRYGKGPHCTVVVVNRGDKRIDAAIIRLDTAAMGLGADPGKVKVEDVDTSLLTLMWGQEPRKPIPADDPTTAEKPDLQKASAKDVSEEKTSELELDEKESFDVSSPEGRGKHPDAKFSWADGELRCAVRRHDYRLFRFSQIK